MSVHSRNSLEGCQDWLQSRRHKTIWPVVLMNKLNFGMSLFIHQDVARYTTVLHLVFEIKSRCKQTIFYEFVWPNVQDSSPLFQRFCTPFFTSELDVAVNFPVCRHDSSVLPKLCQCRLRDCFENLLS